VVGWELNNHRALRMGDWKLVMAQPPLGDRQWKLYNLEADPSESKDLSAQRPDIFKKLMAAWQDYVKQNGVVLLEQRKSLKKY